MSFSFNTLRIKEKNKNPLISDADISNQILLYAINKSSYHYSVSVGGDIYYFFDREYPPNMVYLRLNFIKYPANRSTIEDFVKKLNIALMSDQITVRIESCEKTQDSISSLFFSLRFIDSKGKELTSPKYAAAQERNELSSFKVRMWADLSILNEKCFLYFERDERLLMTELDRIANYDMFAPYPVSLKRIKYFLSTKRMNLADVKSCCTKFAQINKQLKQDYLESLYEIFQNVDLDDESKNKLFKFLRK